ncbi:hypothetical protein FCG41_09485 [Azotobacter chroococcum]|nr:hypothetical protein FCG41_09485 [Azotobacter chroococcum]
MGGLIQMVMGCLARAYADNDSLITRKNPMGQGMLTLNYRISQKISLVIGFATCSQDIPHYPLEKDIGVKALNTIFALNQVKQGIYFHRAVPRRVGLAEKHCIESHINLLS